jgi:hypothetical protein
MASRSVARIVNGEPRTGQKIDSVNANTTQLEAGNEKPYLAAGNELEKNRSNLT